MSKSISSPLIDQNVQSAIDVVYLWVDGSSSDFTSQLNATLQQETPHPSAVDPRRFRNNDELRFSLRSIHKFAPWIRNIFIVTNGQLPTWLNRKHPKIKLVEHRDIFADKDHLPTFNSLAIEWQLHRIPGLSEYFLQMNDDFFIGRPVSPEDFFTSQGGVKFFVEDLLIRQESNDDVFYASAAKTLKALREIFGDTLEMRFPAHTPRLFVKGVIAELASALSTEVKLTSSNRFRTKMDLLLPAAHAGWLKAENHSINEEVILSEPSELYRFLRLDLAWWWWSRSLINMAIKPPLFYCINDDMKGGFLGWAASKGLKAFLRCVLSEPSPYEKT